MKYILILSIIAASLGSCAIVPAGYGGSRDRYYRNHDGYDRNRSYSRGGDSYHWDRNYNEVTGITAITATATIATIKDIPSASLAV